MTLPAGMQRNPSAANGLQACSEQQIGYEGQPGPHRYSPGAPQPLSFSSEPADCPEASKLGLVRIATPVLAHELTGSLYLARQDANPFGSLLAVYLVAEDPYSGIKVKLAGLAEANPETGQITTTFQNTPQVPFEELHLELSGGPRASLSTPALCGSYTANASFTAGSGALREPASEPPFTVTSGPAGGPCPSSPLPFYFEYNPTSCEPMKIEGTLTGSQGASAGVSSPFQVSGCRSLPFKPAVLATTRGQTSKADGASLGLTFKSKTGEAHVARTILTIPATLPARLTTIQKACIAAVFEVNPAAAGSDIGTATVHTPVRKSPLAGPIYLVSHGNAAWPDAELVLQGEGITVILDGQTAIKKGVTTSSFQTVPDAPFESVEATLPEEPHSALTTSLPLKDHYSLCGQHLTIPTSLTGQNGAALIDTVEVSVQGCHAVKARKANHRTRKQRLVRALKACRKRYKHSRTKRAGCERTARRRYSPNRSRSHRAHKTQR
ncbi:MAG TPA: hypothetical protein VMA77_33155 [Solirubrobacteraceae bacterium]|nr:hypothetical protein [Solirubrobacteraceae bacterium]